MTTRVRSTASIFSEIVLQFIRYKLQVLLNLKRFPKQTEDRKEDEVSLEESI